MVAAQVGRQLPAPDCRGHDGSRASSACCRRHLGFDYERAAVLAIPSADMA